MAADSDEAARALEEMLGHRFADRGWLAAGLRHSSLRQRKRTAEFERLEFLGDRVVGLVVADLLLGRFPDEPEGHLARRHAALVQRDTLAHVARGIGAPRLVRLTGVTASVVGAGFLVLALVA